MSNVVIDFQKYKQAKASGEDYFKREEIPVEEVRVELAECPFCFAPIKVVDYNNGEQSAEYDLEYALALDKEISELERKELIATVNSVDEIRALTEAAEDELTEFENRLGHIGTVHQNRMLREALSRGLKVLLAAGFDKESLMHIFDLSQIEGELDVGLEESSQRVS